MTGNPLKERLRHEAELTGLSLTKLTVLTKCRDPYRMDTPENHGIGAWVAATMQRLRVPPVIHLRGLHYILVSAKRPIIRPDGLPYKNTESDWVWLQEKAAKAARWLKYIPFEAIKDERNAETVVYEPELRFDHSPRVSFGSGIKLPYDLADELEARGGEPAPPHVPHPPVVSVSLPRPPQPYRLVMLGEKSSLASVLQPVAEQYFASMTMATGECSDTRLHEIASDCAEDGRPAVVLYFSDADPSGWQMPISAARKLQAFRDLEFPDLDIRVLRVALTPDQVRAYGLPSTPLKETERRGDRWRQEFGIDQTEIDALAALQPDLLVELAEAAIAPFFDATLEDRAREAELNYFVAEQRRLRAWAADRPEIENLRQRGATLAQLIKDQRRQEREAVEELDREMEEAVAGFEPGEPPPDPEAETTGKPVSDLVYDSDVPWTEATRRLCELKAYGGNDKDD